MEWTPITDYTQVPTGVLVFKNQEEELEGVLQWINFISPKDWGIVDKYGKWFRRADDFTHYRVRG